MRNKRAGKNLSRSASAAQQTANDGNGKHTITVATEVTEFHGPLPHPDILHQYDQVAPGLAKQIVDWAISETNHRHEIERGALALNTEKVGIHKIETRIGQICGLVIALSVVSAVVYLAMNDKQLVAATLAAIGFGGIIGAFVLGRQEKKTQDGSGQSKHP